MPIWSAVRCPASVRCAPVAATFGSQVTRRCSPEEKLCMQPRECVPAGARRSNLILTGLALCWAVRAAVPSIKTALLAAVRTSVPKPGACTHASTSLISSSASKLSTNVLAAAAPVRSKPPSVTLWRQCDLKALRNHAPAFGWPRTASPAGRGLRRHLMACAARHWHRPGARNPP